MSDVVIASLVASAVAAMAGWLTQRSASRATRDVATTTTRGDIEKEAFQRAESYYKTALDRQEAEIQDNQGEITDLKTRVGALEKETARLASQVRYYRRTGRRLAQAVHEMRILISARDGVAAPTDPDLEEAVLEFLGTDPV